jgi:hypothetical protein
MKTLPKISEKIEETLQHNELEDKTRYELVKIDFDGVPSSNLRSSLRNITFKKCLFSQQLITDYQFHGCIFEDCQFNFAVFSKCEFHKCKFINCTFYKTKISDTYLDPSSFKFDPQWYRKWANVNAWWFQAVFRNSKNMHQEDFAMVADKQFQFYRRYDYLFGKQKKPFSFLNSLFYDIGLGYGYGIVNALIVTCFFIFIFAMVMMNQTTHTGHFGVVESVYFAVVSFTTVGYGEITPAKNVFALMITTAFLFFSVVWGAIVTAVVVKRLVR